MTVFTRIFSLLALVAITVALVGAVDSAFAGGFRAAHQSAPPARSLERGFPSLPSATAPIGWLSGYVAGRTDE
jgi:FlaG/FlaF family flagellin (archaellin)